MAVCLPEPPVTVPVHVLKFQYPQPLVSRDAQLVGTTSFKGVESIVNLNGDKTKATLAHGSSRRINEAECFKHHSRRAESHLMTVWFTFAAFCLWLEVLLLAAHWPPLATVISVSPLVWVVLLRVCVALRSTVPERRLLQAARARLTPVGRVSVSGRVLRVPVAGRISERLIGEFPVVSRGGFYGALTRVSVRYVPGLTPTR